jgi:hypothetical protein
LQFPHEDVVMDPIEELFEIDVHHPAPARLHVPLRLTHRIVRRASRPESIASLGKRGGESRLQDLEDGLLDEAIEYGRDA